MAITGLACQMGERIASTSALATSETGRLPMRGKAYRSRLFRHARTCSAFFQPACFCSITAAAASAKVGML